MEVDCNEVTCITGVHCNAGPLAVQCTAMMYSIMSQILHVLLLFHVGSLLVMSALYRTICYFNPIECSV